MGITPTQLNLFNTESNPTMATNRPNFGSLLDKAPSEVERPKPGPEGSYLWVVQGLPRMDKSSKKQTEFVEFTLKAVQAGDDVDPEALEAFLTMPDGSKKPLGDFTQKGTFYLTENSLWRLKDFLTHCGIDVDEAESLRQAIEETPNCQVVGYVRHEASSDGESVFARVDKFASADDFNASEAEAA